MFNLCSGRVATPLIRHLWHQPCFSSVLLGSSKSKGSFLSGCFGVSNVIVQQRSLCNTYSPMASEADGGAAMPSDSQWHYQVVVAATRDMGIGKDGKLPWKLPSELKFFKELTSTTSDPHKKNAVLMGRKTWESIPLHYRPLPRRLNVVLSRSTNIEIDANEDVVLCGSLDSALEVLSMSPYQSTIENVFIIGGGQILREALNAPQCDAIHITEIETSIDCDTFIPAIDLSVFRPWYSSSSVIENDIRYSFVTYVNLSNSTDFDKFDLERILALPKMIFERHEECIYLKLIQEIMSSGTSTQRAGSGCLSKFGSQMRFNLRKSFPLFTTKRLIWQDIVEELLQFISGSPNAQILCEKDFHTPDDNGCREHHVSLVDSEKIDMETSHRIQWTKLGARCTDTNPGHTARGLDQLSDVIDKINSRLHDKRIILSAWNPSDLQSSPLPPCDMFAQFYVSNGELSCQMYQGSADVCHVPYTVASFALLTCIIARISGLLPGEINYVIGDAYINESHIGLCKEQLQKLPRPFPILKINPERKDVDLFAAADFELVGYYPHS